MGRDLMRYTKEKKIPFYILQIDQEKAFYKMDQQFLYKTTETIELYTIFINLIKTLYQSNTSIILVYNTSITMIFYEHQFLSHED